MHHFLVFTLIFFLSLPAVAVADASSGLPAGFIALSESRMTWNQAHAYCQQLGGRLPLIGGSESLDKDSVPPGTSVDSFSARGASWPTGLFSARYWTGTANSSRSGDSWIVRNNGGEVDIGGAHQGDTLRAVCVP